MRMRSLLCLALAAGLLVSAGAPPRAWAGPTANFEVLLVKANLALKQGKYADALKMAQEALAQDANQPLALAIQGRSQLELGDTAGSLATFGKLDAIKPKDNSWRTAYGIALLRMEMPKDAVPQLEKGVAADPEDGVGRYSLGFAYYLTGQYRKALPQFEAAIERESELHAAHYYRGRCYAQAGETAEARRDLEAAIAQNPAGPLAESARQAIASLGEGGAAPAAKKDEEGAAYAGKIKVGFAYDSNVLLANDDLVVTQNPYGDPKDGRVEVELQLGARKELDKDLAASAGYNFIGHFQLGFGGQPGGATRDFSITTHVGRAGLEYALNAENTVGVSGNYILTALGPLDSMHPLSQQALGTISYTYKHSKETSLGAFVQYGRDFFPRKGISLPHKGTSSPLDVRQLDANNLHPGITWTESFDQGYFSLTGSLFWRRNDKQFNTSGTPGAKDTYVGPRFEVEVKRKIPEIDENLTASVDAFYSYENHYAYKEAGLKHEQGHRTIGTVTLGYQFTDHLSAEASFRGEGLDTNVAGSVVVDRSYQRFIGAIGLIYEQ